MPNDAADGSKLRCYAKSGPGAAGEISVLASGQPVSRQVEQNNSQPRPAKRFGKTCQEGRFRSPSVDKQGCSGWRARGFEKIDLQIPAPLQRSVSKVEARPFGERWIICGPAAPWAVKQPQRRFGSGRGRIA